MGKIFAIGDVHGCLVKLMTMMERIDVDSETDTLVFVGDYIDRGPDSRGVVDFVLDLRSTLHHVVCLLGNHEQMLLNYYLYGRDRELYFLNGGLATIRSYGRAETPEGMTIDIPDEHLEFFRSLEPYYETDDYIFVHAGLRPGVPLDAQTLDDLIWIRYEFIHSRQDFEKIVVFGHTPLPKPLIEDNKIGIDTGACYGRQLTCIVLPEMEVIQV